MTVARWLSIMFHPFIMVGVMVGVAASARGTADDAIRGVGTVALFTIVPMAVLMWRQVRHRRWENADASNRAERPVLYVVGGAGLAALLAYLMLVPRQRVMAGGVIVTLVMVAVSAVMTRWIKVSLHMAFATLAATVLALMRSPVGYMLLLGLPALLWARLALDRHTPREAALGTLIGATAGIAMHYWYS